MDLEEIRVEVYRRTGINIEPGYPFYAALVMLNVVATRIEQNNTASQTLIEQKLEAGLRENASRSTATHAPLPLGDDMDVMALGRTMAIALAAFALLMIVLGAYIGGNRENWGIAGIVGSSAGVSMIAGIAIGYYTHSRIAVARARKAFWNEPRRRAWRDELKRKLEEK